MGYRIVRMSRELFEQMFTEGATFPSADNQRLRITKGLPEGAKLDDISHHLWFNTGDVALRFSHESWVDEPGMAIPTIDVEFAMEQTTEFQRWQIPTLTDEERQELIQLLSQTMTVAVGG